MQDHSYLTIISSRLLSSALCIRFSTTDTYLQQSQITFPGPTDKKDRTTHILTNYGSTQFLRIMKAEYDGYDEVIDDRVAFFEDKTGELASFTLKFRE